MRIIFVEFNSQVKEILSNKEKFKNDLIISLYHETSYLLLKNKIKYFETSYFCNHKDLWEKYKEITMNSLNIAQALDSALWSKDKRFRELKWNYFDDYHYILKISYDQLYYYCELIHQVIKKYNPTEIWVADTKHIKLNSRCLISKESSVLKFLLNNIKNNNINIICMSADFRKKSKKNYGDIVKKTKNLIFKLNFFFGFYFSKTNYLSVNCNEISALKKLYPKFSKNFLSYNYENLNDSKLEKKWEFFDEFVDSLKKNYNFIKLTNHRNINFDFIFFQILLKITKRLDFFINEYDRLKKITNKLKPLSVIFQTTTPAYSPNIIFRKICTNLNIPFATWMHGGGGLTKSLLHYDVTDFRISNNLISRGEYLDELLKDSSCVLNKLNFKNDTKVFSIGSIRLDYFYKKNFPKNTKKIKKPLITFVSGSFQMKNRFYFGYNGKKTPGHWLTDYKILNILKKYQENYQIVFKDYPGIGSPNLWKTVLKDINAENILYESNQKNLYNLLSNSDLVILPNMSSAFFDALYFDGDIFAIDEDLYEKPFQQKLKNEIFYFKDMNKFEIYLDKYLKEGKFSRNIKKNSKNYFLNFDELNNREKLLREALNFISKN